MSATPPRWLFIVSPERHDLCIQLARRLSGVALVIEDRRRRERRETAAPVLLSAVVGSGGAR